MIVYQVSCLVDKSVAERWEAYFKSTHLEDVLNTGCFTGYSFRKELREGKTTLFVSEYYCNSQTDLDRYNTKFASELKADIMSKFEEGYTCSRIIFTELTKK